VPDTIGKSLDLSQLRQLDRFASKVNKLGVNFAVFDAGGELVSLREGSRFKSATERLIEASRVMLDAYCANGDTQCNIHNTIFAAILSLSNEVLGVAVIDLGDEPNLAEREAYIEQDKKQDRGCEIRDTIWGEMLGLLVENFQAVTQADQQIEMVSTELSQVYEELVLLHKLSTNMKVTKSDANFLQMACDSLTEIVSVEGIAVLLEKTVEDEKQVVVAAGSGLIDTDERMTAILYNRLAEEMSLGKEVLLDSEVDSPFKYDWPNNIKNIIAVPLCGSDRRGHHSGRKTEDSNPMMGLMVAINRIDKQDFDSIDVKLFNSVANGCAVFIENGRLFKDLEELFIGSLKALTSSIDAKDRYTRGHSERVAFISRWIAERLAEEGLLEEEQIHKIYLAGLLHDIGKIGIDEAVLRKAGKLTEQELNRIRMHPSIGASILSGIKQMRDIVPGVLYHHERIDGKGYPNGLTGKQVPLAGKIVGLADSFDAMTSKRTYRDAKTVEQALMEIEKGLGTQFDEKVGRTFLSSDVYQLWDMMQEGSNEIYGDTNSIKYGTVALETLIR
jgi:HD-GYP domain-containing protein (c-di-GMP phosphodiesterase class II)